MSHKQASDLQRLINMVVKVDGCRVFQGYLHNGYGRFSYQGKSAAAHRASLMIYGIEIPEGYEVDHLCRNRACVYPGHLEPVTKLENVRRSTVAEVNGLRMRSMTHCKRGHAFSEENTRIYKNKLGVTERRCRQCNVLWSRSLRAGRRMDVELAA